MLGLACCLIGRIVVEVGPTRYWVFETRELENIRVARDKLLWGFWDRGAGRLGRPNWVRFVRLYDKIRPLDIALLQVTETEEVHALGVVSGKHYDDQTLVWPEEHKEGRALFPWRVEFGLVLFSEEPLARIPLESMAEYVEGFGIGALSKDVAEDVLGRIRERLRVDVRVR